MLNTNNQISTRFLENSTTLCINLLKTICLFQIKYSQTGSVLMNQNISQYEDFQLN